MRSLYEKNRHKMTYSLVSKEDQHLGVFQPLEAGRPLVRLVTMQTVEAGRMH